jgi:hypothetical protein
VYLPLPETDPDVSYPVIVGSRAYVTAWSRGGENYAYSIDLRTGKVVWGPTDIGPTGNWTSLAYDDGRLFVTNSEGDLEALDPKTGATIWEDPGASDNSDAPTAIDGVVYIGPDVQAYSESTGKRLWWANTSGTTGMPAVSGGRVYAPGADDNVYAYTTSEKLAWKYLGPDQGDETVMPVISDGDVFVRTPDVSYQSAYPGWVHSVSTGAQLGTFSSWAIPAASSSYLYATTEISSASWPDTQLSAYKRSTGAVAWTFAGDDTLNSSPLVAKRRRLRRLLGPAPLSISATTLGGADPQDFALGANSCTGKSVGAGASRSISFAFKPTATSTRAAALNLATNDGESHAVALTGTGTS